MQLDGFTLIAQVVNFLILVYLLKRFLYRPVLAAMERREATINVRLEEAASREQTATEAIAAYRAKTEALAEQHKYLLAQIKTETEQERTQQLQAVRHDIEQLRQRWQQELMQEQTQFMQDIRQQLSRNVCQISRQMLADLAAAELEDQLITVLLQQLQQLDPAQQQTLAQSCRIADAESAEIIITSAFTMTPEQQQRVREAMQQLLHQDSLLLHFQQQQELICGIRLDTPQQTLSWSISDYIDQCEKQLSASFTQQQAQLN